MRILFHSLIAFFLLTLSSVLMQATDNSSFVPNLLLPVIIYLTFFYPLYTVLLLSTLFGYMADRFCLAPTGFHIILFVSVVLFLKVISLNLNFAHRIGASISAFLSQFFTTLLGYVLLLSLTDNASFPSNFHAIPLPSMIICGLISFFLWPLQSKIDSEKPESHLSLLQRR